jgi:hypothetical protein
MLEQKIFELVSTATFDEWVTVIQSTDEDCSYRVYDRYGHCFDVLKVVFETDSQGYPVSWSYVVNQEWEGFRASELEHLYNLLLNHANKI